MSGLKKSMSSALPPTRRSYRLPIVAIGAFLLLALALSGCGANLLATANADTTAHTQVSSAQNATGYPIKVFFSKNPDSFNNSQAVYAVDRTSPTIAVATFSIQLLIAGPTLSERNAGYFSELNSLLSGSSNCSAPLPTGGPDFTLMLKSGTVTLQFCRAIASPGIGADARVKAEIDATLKQFSNIKNVVILTESGNCFGDEMGKNACLK